jgi:hypothetical protein
MWYPKLEVMIRHKELYHKFHRMPYKIAYSMEWLLLLENALNCVHLMRKRPAKSSAIEEKGSSIQNLKRKNLS